MLQYEDTVRGEIEPCAACDVLVDEADVFLIDDRWLCEDCAEDQAAIERA